MTPSATSAVARLSIMMFLQFFIWGSWYVTVANFIDAVEWPNREVADIVGWAYKVGPIAALISPLFLGVIADRFFPTQIVLGALHAIGGVLMFLVPTTAAASPDSDAFLWLLAGYMLCYMPTLGLTNTLAFHNLSNRERQFPVVRVFGTIGWIVANVIVSYVFEADEKAFQFQLTGGASLLMAAYSLTLPRTPPPMRGQEVRIGALFGLDAVGLLGNRSFFVFMLASLLICIPLAAYYAWAQVYVKEVGFEHPAATMSWGQGTEVLFMVLMPFFFVRLGVKWMIAVGMLAWAARYALFSFAAPNEVLWMVFGGILLHGICYDFFFVTGQIYVDRFAPREIRGQAQGFLVLITQGLGLGIGADLAARLVAGHTEGEVRDWQSIWAAPAIFAGVVLVLFVLAFRDRTRRADPS